jgi:hypothetical protein
MPVAAPVSSEGRCRTPVRNLALAGTLVLAALIGLAPSASAWPELCAGSDGQGECQVHVYDCEWFRHVPDGTCVCYDIIHPYGVETDAATFEHCVLPSPISGPRNAVEVAAQPSPVLSASSASTAVAGPDHDYCAGWGMGGEPQCYVWLDHCSEPSGYCSGTCIIQDGPERTTCDFPLGDARVSTGAAVAGPGRVAPVAVSSRLVDAIDVVGGPDDDLVCFFWGSGEPSECLIAVEPCSGPAGWCTGGCALDWNKDHICQWTP